MPTATDAYIDQLPEGLASYPECQARLDIFMVLLDRMPRDQWNPRFARAIEPYLAAGAHGWVPEVLCASITTMLRDEVGSDDALREVAYMESIALYEKPLYRALMKVLSPTLLAMGTARRWGASHRGTELESVRWEREGDTTITFLELRHPPGLFLRVHHLAYGEALRAAAEVTRAKSVEVEIESDHDMGRYRVAYGR